MPNVASYFNQINWANPSWDVFLIVFIMIVAIIYGLSLGRDRLILIFVCLYMSLTITNVAPFFKHLPPLTVDQLFILKSGSFLGILLILFFLLSRSSLFRTISETQKHSGGAVIIFSLLHVGLLVSVILSFMPENYGTYLGPLTKDLFLSGPAQFLWIIIPIIMMAITTRHRSPYNYNPPKHHLFHHNTKPPLGH